MVTGRLECCGQRTVLVRDKETVMRLRRNIGILVNKVLLPICDADFIYNPLIIEIPTVPVDNKTHNYTTAVIVRGSKLKNLLHGKQKIYPNGIITPGGGNRGRPRSWTGGTPRRQLVGGMKGNLRKIAKGRPPGGRIQGKRGGFKGKPRRGKPQGGGKGRGNPRGDIGWLFGGGRFGDTKWRPPGGGKGIRRRNGRKIVKKNVTFSQGQVKEVLRAVANSMARVNKNIKKVFLKKLQALGLPMGNKTVEDKPAYLQRRCQSNYACPYN